ncbi:ribosome maturation factor RimP [Ornithinimicrobium sp. W1679]|uniref:ribosome maturation factor RimP n=1 Tax=unclassified Ornithinimicrobium TaxID=2615080 RepID=UPI003CEC9FE6
MDSRARTELLTQQVAESLQGSGVVVDEVVVQQAGRRRLVRVFVARDVDGLDPDDTTSAVEPLTLDEIAVATRTVSDTLDSTDAMGTGPYTLEVSSPGVDRPLGSPAQFRRNVGRLVTVSRTDGSPVTGRLVRVDADGVRLEDVRAGNDDPAGKQPQDGKGLELAWPTIERAAVQVEFSRPDGKDH